MKVSKAVTASSLVLLLWVDAAFASDALPQGVSEAAPWMGPAVLAIFVIAYGLVVAEERLQLQKSSRWWRQQR